VLRICIWVCIREGDKRIRKLYNDDINDSYCSTYIIMMGKSMRIKKVGWVR
jgi:hypothetical protein